MVTLIIDGVSVAAPSVDRCHAAFQDIMGRPGKVVIDWDQCRENLETRLTVEPATPMGFAISPTSGQMTAVA